MQKDEIFKHRGSHPFCFDEDVAVVFDDMLNRSVPFYKEVQKLAVEYIKRRYPNDISLFDLGFSTASFLIALWQNLNNPAYLGGIDSSEAMVERARQNAKAYGAKLDLVCADMTGFSYGSYDVMSSFYTLQFIAPQKRSEILSSIYSALNDRGIFIFSEKVRFEQEEFGQEIVDIYHNYKHQNGYSLHEIAQKKEALENVLIPFTIKQNIALCKEAGFENVDTLFQWGNFVTFVARK